MTKKVYKIRHKATGLFYAPKPARLVEESKAKIYTSKRTMLSNLRGPNGERYCDPIWLPHDSKLFKEHEEALRNCVWDKDFNWIYTHFEDYELVEYELELKEVGVVELPPCK